MRSSIIGRAYAPTTTYFDPTFSVRAIQDRTNAAGTDVDDLSGEEDRLIQSILSGGVIGANSFRVVQRGAGANMSVDVGSGTAKADLAVVPGTDPGQGNYMARLDDTVDNLTIEASDPSNPRIDQVYLVVLDDAYDSTSRGLPRLAVRKGDPAASPVAPGADAGWSAFLLLASITVGAGVTSIVTANITDGRSRAFVSLPGETHQSSILGTSVTSLSTTSYTTCLTGSYVPPAHWNTYRLQAYTVVFFNVLNGQTPRVRLQIGGTSGGEISPSFISGIGLPLSTAFERTGLSGTVTVNAQASRTVGDVQGVLCTAILLRAIRES